MIAHSIWTTPGPRQPQPPSLPLPRGWYVGGLRRDAPAYTTALRAATSRKNDALIFGVRFCVL